MVDYFLNILSGHIGSSYRKVLEASSFDVIGDVPDCDSLLELSEIRDKVEGLEGKTGLLDVGCGLSASTVRSVAAFITSMIAMSIFCIDSCSSLGLLREMAACECWGMALTKSQAWLLAHFPDFLFLD